MTNYSKDFKEKVEEKLVLSKREEMIRKELVVPFREYDKLQHNEDYTNWEVREIEGNEVTLFAYFYPGIGCFETVDLDALVSEIRNERVEVLTSEVT